MSESRIFRVNGTKGIRISSGYGTESDERYPRRLKRVVSAESAGSALVLRCLVDAQDTSILGLDTEGAADEKRRVYFVLPHMVSGDDGAEQRNVFMSTHFSDSASTYSPVLVDFTGNYFLTEDRTTIYEQQHPGGRFSVAHKLPEDAVGDYVLRGTLDPSSGQAFVQVTTPVR